MRKNVLVLILFVITLIFSSCTPKETNEYWIISSDRYSLVVAFNSNEEKLVVASLPKLITDLYKLRTETDSDEKEIVESLFNIKSDYYIKGDRVAWQEYNKTLIQLEDLEATDVRASIEALFALTVKHQEVLRKMESSSTLEKVVTDKKTVQKIFKNLETIAKKGIKIKVYDMGRFIDRNFDINTLKLFIADWFSTLLERSMIDE
ncbi:MAG: hypothetical protein WCY53_00860 [Sphaerochaetaceae bacterium]